MEEKRIQLAELKKQKAAIDLQIEIYDHLIAALEASM